MFFVIVLPKLGRCTSPALLEDSVEIGDIVEPAVIAYLHYSHRTVSQQSRSMTEANVNNVLRYTLGCTELEEAAECCRRH